MPDGGPTPAAPTATPEAVKKFNGRDALLRVRDCKPNTDAGHRVPTSRVGERGADAQLMKRNLPVLALLLALGLTAEDRVQTKPGSGGPSASGRIIRSGATHYERLCAGCRGSDGLALEGEAPPLASSSWVAGPETRLIRIVMHGVRGPIQVGDKIYDREMPGVGRRLSDREMASMLSFVRSRWGASSAPIPPEAVRRVRTAAGNRTRYWIAEELLAAP